MSKELGIANMAEELTEIRAEMYKILPALNKLHDRYDRLMRRKGFLNSSIMNLESYLQERNEMPKETWEARELEKGDTDAN
tara:strand:- start:409 stop:651 length:243 start_codon:yes stop_codon:yes gene_type:complete